MSKFSNKPIVQQQLSNKQSPQHRSVTASRIAPSDDLTKQAASTMEASRQRTRLEQQLESAIIAGRTARVRTLLQRHPALVETIYHYEDLGQLYEQKFYRPLHLAAIYGRAASLQLLLESGADVTARTHSGRLPLFYAVAHMLPLYRAAKMTRALMAAMQSRLGEEVAAMALAATTDQLLADREKGSFYLLVLDAAGADLNARDALGRTAWHHAVLNGNIDGFDMLMELRDQKLRHRKLGAQADAFDSESLLAEPADHQGDTPLQLAVELALQTFKQQTIREQTFREQEPAAITAQQKPIDTKLALKMVATVLLYRCDPSRPNRHGQSPEELAKASQWRPIIECFEKKSIHQSAQ